MAEHAGAAQHAAASAEFAMEVPVQLVGHAFGGNFATAPAGPGSVALSTGELSIPATDATLPGAGISAGRNWLSFASDRQVPGIFGPGWQPNLPTADYGALEATVTDLSASDNAFFLEYPDGSEEIYVRPDSQTGDFTGAGLTAPEGSKLTLAGDTLTLLDASSTSSVWKKINGVWEPSTVAALLEQGKTKIVKERPGPGATPTLVAGIGGRYTSGGKALWCSGLELSAALTTRGCQVLQVIVSPANTSAPAAGQTGAYAGRVSAMRQTLWNPKRSQMESTDVSHYSYTSEGWLAMQWDPRIDPDHPDDLSKQLVTRYEYEAISDSVLALKTLTPASNSDALAPFTFAYDDPDPLRKLTSVSRRDPNQSAPASTVIKYGLSVKQAPNSGLPDMTAETTEKWDQDPASNPVTGVAVFYPNTGHQSWDGSPANPSAKDWTWATLAYLNSAGAATNGAAYGAGDWQIDTTEYNSDGLVSETLSAANRALALGIAKANDGELQLPPPNVTAASTSAARASMLSTATTYSTDKALFGMPVQTLGPATQVVNEKGALVTARTRAVTKYVTPRAGDDYQGMALTDTVTTDALDVGMLPKADFQTRLTKYGYTAILGGVSGDKVRQPTYSEVSSNDGSAVILSRFAYNEAGQLIKSTQPGMPNSSGPGVTVNTYYSAADADSCGGGTAVPEWDGLACTSGPMSQPASPPMPVTTTGKYNMNLQPLESEQDSGARNRKTTTEYDAAGRVTGTTLTGGMPADEPVPAQTITYSSSTGLPVSTSAGAAGKVDTQYDTWARPTRVTDATGNAGVTSYNFASQPATFNDGKGTYSYTYNSASEHRGLLTSQDAGIGSGQPSTTSVTYDAGGAPIQTVYPNGVTAASAFNPSGSLTNLTYSTSEPKPLLAWTQTFNPYGQAVTSAEAGGILTYDYDRAGRLRTAADTRTLAQTGGSKCVVRAYDLSAMSNREKKVQTATPSQSCNTGEAGSAVTTWTNTFDDTYLGRQLSTSINNGPAGTYEYDNFGRTTTLPAVDTTDAGAPAAKLGYYANDTVYSQTQGGTTQTFTLDPLNRQQGWSTKTDDNALQTGVNKFAGTSDSPAWIQRGDAWDRMITGPGGLSIIARGTGTTVEESTLQLANPHGDITSTIPNTANVTAAKMTAINTTDEFGIPLTTPPVTYGWEGKAQRSRNAQAGLILMGARQYSTFTGRFLSIDPVPGGTANPYAYPTDPVNEDDLTGLYKLSYVEDCGWASCSYYFTRKTTKKLKKTMDRYANMSNWGAAGAAALACSKIGNGYVAAGCAAVGAFYASFAMDKFTQAVQDKACVRLRFQKGGGIPFIYVDNSGFCYDK